MGGVAAGGDGQALPLQAVSGPGPDSGVEAGEDGHAQEHPGHTPQAAAHQDGNHDPEAGNAGAVPQDAGAQDVAVELLESQDDWSRPPPR